MEKELTEIQNEIELLQNYKECCVVKLYYLKNNSFNLNEKEINEIKLQSFSIQDTIQNLTIRIAQLNVLFGNLYAEYIESKNNSVKQ